MKTCESKQVILEQLRSTENAPSDLIRFIKENSRFWRAIKYTKDLPHGARIETVSFLKECSLPGYQVHALTFKDNAGLTWRIFCLLVQDATGVWSIVSCCGNAGNALLSFPQRRLPRIMLSGEIDTYFYAGGDVLNHSRIDIARVRLLFQDGVSVEDVVQKGYPVLFVMSQKVQMPVQVEFYNHFGTLVHSYETSNIWG